MSVQLSPEQERRVQSLVDGGLYNSREEVVDAALAAVERQALPGFDGTQEELEALLQEGLDSGEPIEVNEAYWSRLTAETDRMVAEHKARKPRR